MSATDGLTVDKTSTKPALKRPGKWNVVMHNDETTPMDLVVLILVHVFHYEQENAITAMMKIHNEEAAVVGTYTKEIAEEKQAMSKRIAIRYGYDNFTTTIEEE